MRTLKKVYDLREDERLSHRITGASPGPIRISCEHGETGSAAWWDAIASGRLTQRTIQGRIVGIFGSGLPASDWPEFEIESADGRTRWSRYASAGAADSRERREAIDMYQVGRRVRLRYVLEPIERPLPRQGIREHGARCMDQRGYESLILPIPSNSGGLHARPSAVRTSRTAHIETRHSV
jgi:hypothetical protein